MSGDAGLSFIALGPVLLSRICTLKSNFGRFASNILEASGTKDGQLGEVGVDLLPMPLYIDLAERSGVEHELFVCMKKDGVEDSKRGAPCKSCWEFSIAAWLALVILALNYVYLANGRMADTVDMQKSPPRAMFGPMSPAQVEVSDRLTEHITYFLSQND